MDGVNEAHYGRGALCSVSSLRARGCEIQAQWIPGHCAATNSG